MRVVSVLLTMAALAAFFCLGVSAALEALRRYFPLTYRVLEAEIKAREEAARAAGEEEQA